MLKIKYALFKIKNLLEPLTFSFLELHLKALDDVLKKVLVTTALMVKHKVSADEKWANL